jgi:Domain of unknown function (DUF222)
VADSRLIRRPISVVSWGEHTFVWSGGRHGSRRGNAAGQLEREITELAAHINAATCRWLLLVGELDRREGWAEWGCKSCAHWLSLRCGVGLTAAREQVRVARALSGLPLTAASFGRGELSYSQGRAITRVATREIEDELLSVARNATGAQLEVLVRAYRGVLARDLEATNDAHRDRYLYYSHEDDGTLVLSGRIPAEEGALVRAALEAAGDAVRARVQGNEGAEDASAEASAGPAARWADALVVIAETMMASGPKPAPGGERHELVVHVDASTLADDEDGACALGAGPALHAETARRLGCDASVVRILERDGRPLSVGRKTRQRAPSPGASTPHLRRRLSLPRLHGTPLRRRPPHRALGPRRQDRPPTSSSSAALTIAWCTRAATGSRGG